ncbi:MAG: hemolysin III family protein [Bacillota bacterium]|nr:hemolysin III family protein [Bacillota bacterium]
MSIVDGVWTRLQRRVREPVSGLTHLVGAVLSAVGLVVLVVAAVRRGTVWHITSFAIFGASLVLLYTASSLYHLLPLAPRGVQALRRLDHMMIYVLIAGTYTPFCLTALRGTWGWALLGTVWGLAAAGIILKAVWMHAPPWVSVLFYMGMGWLVVTALVPLARSVPQVALWLLAGGGLCYTVGAVFYATRWPRLFPGRFSFHEVWHLFVIAGSVSHYLAVFQLLA